MTTRVYGKNFSLDRAPFKRPEFWDVMPAGWVVIFGHYRRGVYLKTARLAPDVWLDAGVRVQVFET